jgi:hypothetical protein
VEKEMPKTQVFSLFVASLMLFAPEFAQAETGRYTMTPTKDGVLKLDTHTGSVSLCHRAESGWSCQGVDENDTDLRQKLKRLEQENADLRAKLESRKMLPPSVEGGKLDLPTEEEVDKAMDFMEKLLNRFKGMMEGMRKGEKEEDGVPL